MRMLPLAIMVSVAMDGNRKALRAALHCQVERAFLEGQHAAVLRARALHNVVM